jgi:hypothetical protein
VDNDRVDSLARSIFAGSRQTRRGVLATVLAATLLRPDGDGLAKRKRRGKGKARGGRTARVMAEASVCYPGTRCAPGRGKNASRCDFSSSTVFRNRDARGANLSNSNFTGADLTGADLRAANLGGGCFVGADLFGAKLGSSVNLGGAVFCNTLMPDGTINDSGCNAATPCCPTCIPISCSELEIECGTAPNGCGGTLRCGSCGTGATPSCNSGTCARCDATCAAGCACFNLADGNTRCGSTLGSDCALACAANADCPSSRPFCVASVTQRGLNETITLATLCGRPGLTGACAEVPGC